MKRFKVVVIGASAGGLDALSIILGYLPKTVLFPVIIAQHVHPEQGGGLVELLSTQYNLKFSEPDDKDPVRPGVVYLTPPNYHLLVNPDETFSLSVDEKVNYSRPSIDVLFESAAHVWGIHLAGILLTGASSDGANGINEINAHGGLTIAQDPATALHPIMPQSAIDTGAVDQVMAVDEIGQFLAELGAKDKTSFKTHQKHKK